MADETSRSRDGETTSKRVLVVDDTESVRILLKRALPSHGFDVIGEAANATEGIEKAKAEQPDVIVLDMQMPDISGAEAIAPLKAEAPNARIVIYSSEEERLIRKQVIDLGADTFVDKMAPIRDMAAEINRVLESS
jgi:DNA-binding NarL/FixJ family response regulator